MKLFSKPYIAWVFLCIFCIQTSCNSIDSRKDYTNSEMYDFASPKVVELPEELNEISGITYYPKDTSVFAIIDEDGLLFKIPLKNPQKYRKWQFEKKKDYEDVVLVDSIFYVLVSNGSIVTVKFNGDQIEAQKSKFKDESGHKNEFEILYDAHDSNNLVMMCKDCDEDSKKTLSSYRYNYRDSSGTYQKGVTFDMRPLMQKLGIEKHLKPSAAAINPVTKDLYIVSSIQKLIVIMGSDGEFKEFYKLDPALYKQPEGIAFTPAGDLIISNEFADDGFATLLLIKNKKK